MGLRKLRFNEDVMGLLSALFGKKKSTRLDIERVAEPELEEPKQTLRAGRENSFMEVQVITGHGYKRQGVAIDVSNTGARLRFHTSESMQSPIRLKIPKLKMDCSADVVWHKGVDVGVRFSGQ